MINKIDILQEAIDFLTKERMREDSYNPDVVFNSRNEGYLRAVNLLEEFKEKQIQLRQQAIDEEIKSDFICLRD